MSLSKSINKYLIQAKKLATANPVVSYYCRMHAVKVGMKLQPKKGSAEEKLLSQVISDLEKQHEVVNGVSKEDAKSRVEAFALAVFKAADDNDRAATPTKQTAVMFRDAFLFMDVVSQFGPLSPEVQGKRKYAMWKTNDILTALKEGRIPESGSEEDRAREAADLQAFEDMPEATESKDGALEQHSAFSHGTDMPPSFLDSPSSASSPFNPHAAPFSNTPHSDTSSASISSSAGYSPLSYTPAQPFVPPAAVSTKTGGAGVSSCSASKRSAPVGNRDDAVLEAEKMIKQASSAIRFDDVDTCVEKLEEALNILRPFQT
eukprot:gb/GEZN01012090.1/.p1 GENE.gb/GEZN01012090.1/~~gb/GEZN01012090.1/.p1  ORF type:complete len:318 (-),score=60.40 gb/GEZN01012090.1/:54-1007(-)